MTRPVEHQQTASSAQSANTEFLRKEILDEQSRLQGFANRGLWSLSLFLLICIYSWHHFPLLPKPETFIAYLGMPPSSQLVSTLFIIYTFFAILLSLSRMIAGVAHHGSFSHVGYLTGFFFFYYVSGALDDNYWAVFVAGLTILAVESYRIRSFCQEALSRARERLEFLEKNGRLPPDE